MFFLSSLLLCLSVAQLCAEDLIFAEEAPQVGGWDKLNPDNPDLQKIAEFAVKKFNSESHSKKMYKLASITSAERQTTRVFNYYFHAVLKQTNCLKSEKKSLDNCRFEKESKKCSFNVSEDPQTSAFEFYHHECSDE